MSIAHMEIVNNSVQNEVSKLRVSVNPGHEWIFLSFKISTASYFQCTHHLYSQLFMATASRKRPFCNLTVFFLNQILVFLSRKRPLCRGPRVVAYERVYTNLITCDIFIFALFHVTRGNKRLID